MEREVSDVALKAYGRRLAEHYRYGTPLPLWLKTWIALKKSVWASRKWLAEKLYPFNPY